MSQKNKQQKIEIIASGREPKNRLLIITPTLGIVRIEWSAARFGAIIPCNWSNGAFWYSSNIPQGYLTADGQNIGAQEAVKQDYEWVFFHEDDVILPQDIFLKLNAYIRKADIPVISGLYYLKAEPSEPIIYRGRGNSYFGDWKQGDKFWVDGVPTGCLLIHCSLLKLMWNESEEYDVPLSNSIMKVRKIFETPRKCWFDPESNQYQTAQGTSDFYWCDRVIKENILPRTDWKKIAKRKYPFFVDTTIFCKHIDLTTGKQYP